MFANSPIATSTAPTNSAASGTKTTKTTSGSNTAKQTGTQTGSKTGSKTGSQSNKGTITGSAQGTAAATGGSSNTTVYDARLPAGGVSMITPNIFSGAQYYRIGDYVTFGWNFTSVSAKPTAINVLATCSANSALYTISANMTYEDVMAVTWDTNLDQAQATAGNLLTNHYTLVIENANENAATKAAAAGYFAAASTYTFGMYTPQPYTPWAGKFSHRLPLE